MGIALPAAAQGQDDARGATLRDDPRAAAAQLAGLAVRNPDDADLLRRLAGAQAAAGDYRAARATIERARTLAPADLDIRAAQARILSWSGDRTGAQRALAELVAMDPAYPERAAIERTIAAPREGVTRGGLSAAFGIAGVDSAAGSQTWSTAALSGYTSIGAATTLSGEITREKRRQVDTHLAATVERRIGQTYVHIGVTATPRADFREKWGVNAGGETPVGGTLTALLDLRYARYAAISVAVAQPGLRYRFAGGKAALTARWINLFGSGDRYRTGASLRGDAELGDGWTVYIGGASYPDTEAGVTRRVRSYFAGGTAALSDRLTLRIGAEHDRRMLSYTRRGATLGLSWRLGG